MSNDRILYLQKLYTDNPTLFDDIKKARGAIQDIYPDKPLIANTLVTALEAGVLRELVSSNNNLPIEMQIPQIAKRLLDEYGVSEEAAVQAVGIWAEVVGKVTEEQLSGVTHRFVTQHAHSVISSSHMSPSPMSQSSTSQSDDREMRVSSKDTPRENQDDYFSLSKKTVFVVAVFVLAILFAILFFKMDNKSETLNKKKNFIKEYLHLISITSIDNIDQATALYSKHVKFYGKDFLMSDIKKDKIKYFRRFPKRTYSLIKPIAFQTVDGVTTASFTYEFYVLRADKHRGLKGLARAKIKFIESKDGDFVIIAEDGSIIHKKKIFE